MSPDEIRAAIEYLDACLRQINDNALNRALDADEQSRWEAGLAERNRLAEQLERHHALAGLAANPGATTAGTAAPFHTNGGHSRTTDPWREVRDGNIRSAGDLEAVAAACIERTARLDDDSKQHATGIVERLGHDCARYVAAVSQPDYARGWLKLAAAPMTANLSSEERAALELVERAMSLTDASGGYAVPFTLDPTFVLTNNGVTNPFRSICRVEQTMTDSWSPVVTAGVTASYDGEAVEVSDDSPTLGQPTVKVWKAQAFVPFSIEIGQDIANLEAELRNAFADAKDRLEGSAFTTGAGDGSNKPTGIITELAGGASEVAPTTAETFAVADIYKIAEALPDRHWANAKWMFNRGIAFKIRQFDNNGGADMWTQLTGGIPGELIGKPYVENSEMDATWDTAASADNFLMILGDWAKFVCVDRVGLTVELVPHLFGDNNRPTGQRGLYAFWRHGSGSIDDNAFRVLNLETTA
jgi:HK97 family phage major capsid protein